MLTEQFRGQALPSFSDGFTGVSSDLENDVSWVEWFCSLKENEPLVEVDANYIRDDFNLTGLSDEVKDFDRALDIILDESNEDDENDEDDDDDAEEDAQALYGLIHARYILTHRGLAAMMEKYNSFVFGFCPNVYCARQPVVPIGLSDRIGVSTAMVFCPRCNEVYHPSEHHVANLDGAVFGTTFPHMFYLQHDHLIPNAPLQYYVPKLYGFNIWRGVKDRLRDERAEKRKQQGAAQGTPPTLTDGAAYEHPSGWPPA